MENEKNPKWPLEEAIQAGRESLQVLQTYGVELQPRLLTDEILQHTANVNELGTRVSGQKQTLTTQMTNTQEQSKVIDELNDVIVSIRNIVRNNNPTEEILIAFGVGNRISHSVNSVITAANIIIDAHTRFAAWSKNAGIIASDITELTDLKALLTDVEKVQDDSVYVRKSKTMDKNTLQIEVENEVTRLSALGMRHFSKNPSAFTLFEDLIPPAHKPKTEPPATNPA